MLGGLGLGAAIVLYDRRHKGNPLSPLLMGLCRVLVYVTAGLAVAYELPPALQLGALLLLCYLIGLTYVAKQETLGEVRNLWPLLFLGAPVVYALAKAAREPDRARARASPSSAWVGVALWFLWRRRPGDVPRAVVSLIAGICAARRGADRRGRRPAGRLAGGAGLRPDARAAAGRARDVTQRLARAPNGSGLD